MKYLVVLLVVLVVFWLWRSSRDALTSTRRDPHAGAPADAARRPSAQLEMVRCRTCGVHLPEAEAVRAEARYYCSVEHLKQDRGG